MAHRVAYDAKYYQDNKERLRPQRRVNMRRYRRNHADAIKVARALRVPIDEARLLLEKRPHGRQESRENCERHQVHGAAQL